MRALWSLALLLAFSRPAAAIDAGEPARRIIMPGQEIRSSCASCSIVLPAGAALPRSTIPQTIPEFAGAPVSLAEDGRPVTPALVTPESAAREPEMTASAGMISASVAHALPALKDSVRLGEWRGPGTTLDEPCCGDAAPKLGLLLRNMGYNVNVVEAEMHYYLLHALSGGQLIVDPTIRQFFGGARAPPEIPTVFVGSVADLHRLFAAHAPAKTTRYDMQRIYFGQAEIRNSRMLELQQALGQRPAPVDMPSLKSFLQGLQHN